MHLIFTTRKFYSILGGYCSRRRESFWKRVFLGCFWPYSYVYTRSDLKICWFAITWVCFFEYTRPVGIFFFYHFEIEKIALILIDNIFVTKKLFFRNKHQKIFLTRTFLVEPVGWRQTNTFLSLVQSIKFFTFQCHIIKRVHMFELGDSWNTQENYRLHLLATFTAKFESIFVLTQENSLS